MDDIVTRLRNKRTEFDNWLNDIEGKHSFGHDESIWLDAADEIERLRAGLAIAAGMISTMPHYEHEHAESIMNMLLAEARAKAVRGE